MNQERMLRRLLMMVGMTRSTATANEAGTVQLMQHGHLATGETHDEVPTSQTYGFASSPMPGTDHVVIYLEGDRSKGIAIASNDQRHRPTGMAPGETQIHDNAGQRVYLQVGTKIVINAVTEINLEIGGNLVGKITSAGLAITGSITATGNITGGFGGADQVDMLNHEHTYRPGTGSPTPTSAPIAGT